MTTSRIAELEAELHELKHMWPIPVPVETFIRSLITTSPPPAALGTEEVAEALIRGRYGDKGSQDRAVNHARTHDTSVWREAKHDAQQVLALLPQPSPEVAAAPSVSGVKDAVARAKYLLNRGVDDLGAGEIDTLLRMVASLASKATPVAGEVKGEPMAWRTGETVRLDVSVGYASPAASFALAAPPAPTDALKALYEWYDRDGSVGGASTVFEEHRSALAAIRAKETT